MPAPSSIRRLGHTAAGLVLGLSVLSAPMSWSAPTPGAEPPASPVDDVRDAAQGALDLTRDTTTGRVTFLSVDGRDADLAPAGPAARSARGNAADAAASKAAAWLVEHADVFGVKVTDLQLSNEITDPHGHTFTYRQSHDGVPVWGAALKANVDADGRLTSVNGRLVPDLDVHTVPSATPAAVVAAATAMVRQDPPTDDEGNPAPIDELDGAATLVVYETGSPQGLAGPQQLAWDVTVTGSGLQERVILSDVGLKALNRWTDVHGLTRHLDSYTPGHVDTTPRDTDDDPYTRTWTEGDALDALTSTQRDLLATTAETFHFFDNAFGRDSWDGAGAPMVMRDNRSAACPNASWHGAYVTFCPGVDSDDIVAHEWGHAYTQETSGLVYQYQSGALNESYSDVWGETIDLLNAREDDGENNTVRTDDTCLERVSIRIAAPRSSAGTCTLLATGLDRLKLIGSRTVSVVNALDAENANGPSNIDACSPLTNAAAVAGRWVYADRGPCAFQVKADNVLAAGGEGLILGNTVSYASAPTALTVTSPLPVLLVSVSDGNRFKSIGSTSALATPKVVITGPSDTGRRWMLGEKATAVNEPLRDMWNPNCMGHPAKVTDAEYHCESSDSGGVHVNSGVPNRAYSLLVDGGTYNGHTVAGVGLDRAAHIWWRAGAAHLVPNSNFSDFANALSVACTTLVGATLAPLSLTADPGTTPVSPITAAQCESLDDVITATELHTDPSEACAWPAHLAPGTPESPCGTGTTTVTGLSENFENVAEVGARWRVETALNAEDWGLVTGLENAHGISVFAPTPNSCEVNRAGVARLYSPAVTLGVDAQSPRLSFRHMVALEEAYDGANVKVRITAPGATPATAWTLPPAAAWVHNAPNATIQDWSTSDPSDNPMRLQKAWSGYDYLDPISTWGTSVLDLTAAGATPGSTVEVRFDLGTDTCVGLLGWSVDDIVIDWCEDVVEGITAPKPVAAPTPSSEGSPLTVAAADTTPAPATPATPTTPPALPEAAAPAAPAKETAATPSVPKPSAPKPVASPTRSSLVIASRGRATKSLSRGRAFTLTATVRTRGVGDRRVDDGRVRFVIGGRTVGSAPVVNGRATLKVSAKKSRSLSVGRRTVRAAFQGTTTARKSTARATVRLRR